MNYNGMNVQTKCQAIRTMVYFELIDILKIFNKLKESEVHIYEGLARKF